MKFRTECEIEKDIDFLSPLKPVVSIGSCFADNITLKMRSCLWKAINPMGVLFNPLSIEKILSMIISDDEEFEASIFTDKNIKHSWLLDSSFSSTSTDELIKKYHCAKEIFIDTLNQGHFLIITFGTAYCYFRTDSSLEIVANCHKQPAKLFERKRISTEDILNKWEPLLDKVKSFDNEIKILFTVSPVRHIRDGFHDNNLSKAILMLAIESMCKKYNFCKYFPAFELVNDDLRDYRFYAEDMVHPSETAVNYIWEKLCDAYISQEGKLILKEGESISKRLSHRPILASESETNDFRSKTIKIYEDFLKRNPHALEIKF